MATIMAKINTKKPTSRKGLPPVEASTNMGEVKQEEMKLINFRVNASFKNDLKSYAAQKGISMTNLLYKMFEEYKSNH